MFYMYSIYDSMNAHMFNCSQLAKLKEYSSHATAMNLEAVGLKNSNYT